MARGPSWRLCWIDAYGYQVVGCDGLTTARALTGCPCESLMHIARSLYPPSEGQGTTSSDVDSSLAALSAVW